ncbi:hypothetical protein JCM19235_2775 [Vibrio maritimus]|uniref:Uncharacterized protein n=1 Tax=Vibrio maritimus TaxID=990268 RepID=A0A090S3F8_9VIBR|nr:hypothetical protein JCM19235_2775 [Vibrio maritimus]
MVLKIEPLMKSEFHIFFGYYFYSQIKLTNITVCAIMLT